MPEFSDGEYDGDVLTESDVKLEKPKLFKVLLHNDDFTTMEFVVFVLIQVFLRSEPEALCNYAESSQRRCRVSRNLLV